MHVYQECDYSKTFLIRSLFYCNTFLYIHKILNSSLFYQFDHLPFPCLFLSVLKSLSLFFKAASSPSDFVPTQIDYSAVAVITTRQGRRQHWLTNLLKIFPAGGRGRVSGWGRLGQHGDGENQEHGDEHLEHLCCLLLFLFVSFAID